MISWTSLAVDIDQCEFYSNGYTVEERNTMSPSAGLAVFLEGDKPPQLVSTTQFAFNYTIRGIEYRFVSPVLRLDMDSLKMRLIFGNGKLHYCLTDPTNYYFEL